MTDLVERLRQVRDLIEDPAFITVATGFARYNADERDLILRAAIDAEAEITRLQRELGNQPRVRMCEPKDE